MTIEIHPELQALIPPLTEQEYAQLEASILANGCKTPLDVWQGRQTILDGHNRYAICVKHSLPYTTREVSLPDLDAAKLYMLILQLDRRELSSMDRAYMMGKRYELEKKKQGSNNQYVQGKNEKAQNEPFQREATAQKIADQSNVSRETVKRAATFARAVDTVVEATGIDARQTILSSDSKVTAQEVKKLAIIAEDNPQTAKNVMAQVKAASTPRAAKKIVDDAVKQVPPPQPKPKVEPKSTPVITLLPQEPEPKRGLETVKSADNRDMFILHNPDSEPVFNRTNEMVDWASWTWNPVTGCWHGCDYCYAREIANSARMAQAYPKQFEPTFHPARLNAPANTKVPKELTRGADKNVFTCSMADLFGKWVPDDWIMQVFERVRIHQEWNFLFLTKFPQRLRDICDKLGGFPVNAWVGCTVDSQARVLAAERAFEHIRAEVCWISVEPMKERLTFNHLEYFDWIVIGGQTVSHYNNTPAFQPEWEWVEHLWQQARKADLKIYEKDNLTVKCKELPWGK